jgi:flagellar biosynthesis protein FlhG
MELSMEDQAEKLREIMRHKTNPQGNSSDNISGNKNYEKTAENRKEKSRPRIITVTSGKGGVGKTNISVNMALAYAR